MLHVSLFPIQLQLVWVGVSEFLGHTQWHPNTVSYILMIVHDSKPPDSTKSTTYLSFTFPPEKGSLQNDPFLCKKWPFCISMIVGWRVGDATDITICCPKAGHMDPQNRYWNIAKFGSKEGATPNSTPPSSQHNKLQRTNTHNKQLTTTAITSLPHSLRHSQLQPVSLSISPFAIDSNQKNGK